MAEISRTAFIDTSDPEEIGYWCHVLKVDRAQLLLTIAWVGTSPAAVVDAVYQQKSWLEEPVKITPPS